jgi:catalase
MLASELNASAGTASGRIGGTRGWAKLTAIAALLATIIAGFAALGGWFSPNRLTPARFVDGFEEVDGVHAGFRRNHAKGVGVTGYFESNGQGARLSKAGVFQSGRVPVIGRFSRGGGQPYKSDSPNDVRGLGLQFTLPDGEVWRTAMINLPVFPFRTPEAFYEQLLASKPDPKTGKPDPAKMEAFAAKHPETVHAIGIIKQHPFSSGFGNSTFYGLNAFRFVNSAGESTPVRWVLKPVQPFEANQTTPSADPNYLFDGLIDQIHRGPVQWHLVVIVGQPGDPTNDANQVWPESREQIDVGTLTLTGVESDDQSAATEITFDPLVLPAGIVPSDDPLLSARSAIYSRGYTRRAGERQEPSAISTSDVRKGE